MPEEEVVVTPDEPNAPESSDASASPDEQGDASASPDEQNTPESLGASPDEPGDVLSREALDSAWRGLAEAEHKRLAEHRRLLGPQGTKK
jgi:hypothetical protein